MIPIAYNIGSLSVRKTTTLTSVLGIALVVFVLASALMLAAGVRRALGTSGRPDAAMVIRKGSDSELSSIVDQTQVGLILAAPGVKKAANGTPIGVGEVIIVAALEKVGSTLGFSNVQVRGVPENVYAFRPNARVTEGRPARPGSSEAVVGAKIRGRFKGLDIGQKVELKKNRPVEIVGILEDGGSTFESEVWADVDVVRSAFGRDGIVSSVRAQLESPEKLDAFREVIEQDKQLGLEAMRETVYYEKQSEGISLFVTFLGVLIAVFFAIGAMIGATITMYASVSSRHREVGTLRALGFGRLTVLSSFLLESFLIALLGGLVGCVASLGMGFVKFSLLNFATWSEIVFTFHPTPTILGVSMAAAIIMGVAGGFFPALRAALISPVQAMRGE